MGCKKEGRRKTFQTRQASKQTLFGISIELSYSSQPFRSAVTGTFSMSRGPQGRFTAFYSQGFIGLEEETTFAWIETLSLMAYVGATANDDRA